MKKLLTVLTALLTAAGAASQNPTAYFMEGSTFRSQFNPAFAPLRGYVNFPGLGGIDVGVSGNLAIDKILYPRNGKLVTLVDSSVSAADALSNLSSNNLLGSDTRTNLIGFGAFAHNHKDFWSFDLNLRGNADARLPYSLFEFLKRGTDGSIHDIGLSAETYLEAAFSYSFPLLRDRLYIGVRGKFLMGAARAQLTYDRFDVSLDEDRWQVDAAGRLDITAGGLDIDYGTGDGGRVYKPGDIDLKPTRPVGYGFAVDLGATFDILPQLQASLAVTDLGFICWSKGDNATGYSAKHLAFDGVEVDGGQIHKQPKFDFDVLEFSQSGARGVTRMLRASINAGLEYEVWRHKIGIGLLYTARIREFGTLHNLTGSVNFHPVRWFTVTGSYSVVDNRGGAVGLALNLCPNWINFFVATDMLTGRHTPQWLPVKQSNMHLTLGIGVPIGKRSHRVQEYIYPKDKR